MARSRQPGLVAILLAALLVVDTPGLWAQAKPQGTKSSAAPKTSSTTKTSPVKPSASATKKTTKRKFTGIPTFADSTKDDIAAFDDPVVRQAAVESLGRYNGSVVVVDPNNGRVLSVVNQRLAFSGGYQPCSTIKPVVAVAALSEGMVRRDTMIKVSRRKYMNLTDAMAHSNNPYFEVLGRQMGFDTLSRYAHLMGLGEQAGLNIFEEHPGWFPAQPAQYGGVGRMSSYGEEIRVTPLQLVSLAMTLANGGTMYYLQYPRNEEERQSFEPRVKRQLNLKPVLPDLRDGLLAAVLYGTAKRGFDAQGEQMLGKTGTCNDQGSRLGWFFAYNDQIHPRLAVAVLLRGQARAVNGSTAADIAGRVFTKLHERNYFADRTPGGIAVAGTSH